MELADLHEVTWGDGYELFYVDDEATDPVYVGHFGYDDAKPTSYMRCTVVGVACAKASSRSRSGIQFESKCRKAPRSR